MKKAVFLIIFISLSFISEAQDLAHSGSQYTLSQAYVAELKVQPEVSDANLIKDNIRNLTDIDWNSYKVIKIGNQVWMAENLKTTKFNDGTKIPAVDDNKMWSKMISPGYCWYNNDKGRYKTKYGVLYNGYTVSTGKLCPLGWHVPTIDDWAILINHYGDIVAGGNLKGTESWMSPNTGASNVSGFTALPGGSRGNLGSFMDAGIRGHWWSSTENDKTDTWNRTMSYANSAVAGSSDHKQSGLSVRCMRDN